MSDFDAIFVEVEEEASPIQRRDADSIVIRGIGEITMQVFNKKN